MRLLPILGLLAPGLILAALPAGATDWTDTFEAYAVGSSLHGQGGWYAWEDNPGYTAYVSAAYAHGPTRSVQISTMNNMVHEFADATSGQWTFATWLRVNDGSYWNFQSYFFLLNICQRGGPWNYSTCLYIYQDYGSWPFLFYVRSIPDGATLPMVTGQWVELRVEIDLDANLQTIYYAGQVLTSKSWTEGVSGGGALNAAAVQLSYGGGDDVVYYDDMSLTGSPVAAEATTWGQLKAALK